MIDIVVPFHRLTDIYNIKTWRAESLEGFKFKFVHDHANKVCHGECEILISDQLNAELTCGEFGAPGLARNAGLELCQSEWIMFLDADDTPDFESISSVQRSAAEKGSNAFIAGFIEINSNGLILRKNPIPKSNLHKYIADRPGLWRFGFSRELLQGILFTNHQWGEDQIFLMKVFSKTELHLYRSNRNIYQYQRNGNAQISGKAESVQDLIGVLKTEYSLFSKWNKSPLQELYDYMICRQTISVVYRLGTRSPVLVLAQIMFIPISPRRIYRKGIYMFHILSNKVFDLLKSKVGR